MKTISWPAMLIRIVIALILLLILPVYLRNYQTQGVTLIEAYLFLSQDRLVLSLVLTLPPLLLTANLFENREYEIQRLIGEKTSIRWMLKKARKILISTLVWTLLYALFVLALGRILELPVETDWANTYAYSNEMAAIDSISRNSYPLEYAYSSNLSIQNLFQIQMILLYARGVFYSLIMMIVSVCTTIPALGFSVAMVFTWIDVNWYKLFGNSAINLAPCFQSTITSINAESPNWVYISSYWFTSIIIFTLIIMIFADNFSENMALSKSKQI